MIILRQRYFSEEPTDEELEERLKNKKAREKKRLKRNLLIGAGAAVVGTGAALIARNQYKKYIDKSKKPEKNYDDIKANIGDIVSASRHGGLYSHYGVVTGMDKSGKPIITNYTNPVGLDPRNSKVIDSSLKDFAEGGDIKVMKSQGKFSPEQLRRRAEKYKKKGFGHYSITRNNCEHFARELADDEHISTQVLDPIQKVVKKTANKIGKLKGKSAPESKNFSKTNKTTTPKNAMDLLKGQAQHMISKDGFEIRKHLSKDLGGLSHFNKYQDVYLTAGGGLVGGVTGRLKAKKRAQKEAKEDYGLRKGTLEYDNYVDRKKKEGTLRGALVGGGLGFASSKGVDTIRGKAIADKARAGHDLDLGKNYMALGKSMRGVKSEEDIEKVKRNFKEVADYGKGIMESL